MHDLHERDTHLNLLHTRKETDTLILGSDNERERMEKLERKKRKEIKEEVKQTNWSQ